MPRATHETLDLTRHRQIKAVAGGPRVIGISDLELPPAELLRALGTRQPTARSRAGSASHATRGSAISAGLAK
jgi:hypothetical protein